MAPKLRRSPSAEGLHRLLGREGLSAAQRRALLALLGSGRRPVAEEVGAASATGATAEHATTEEELELARLRAERDALRVLAAAPDAPQFPAAELAPLSPGGGSLSPPSATQRNATPEARACC